MVEKKNYLVLAVLNDVVEFLNESDDVEQININPSINMNEDTLITITTAIEGKSDKYMIIRKITGTAVNK